MMALCTSNQNKIHTLDAIANCTAEHITPLLYSLIINETELALCYSFHKTIIFGVFLFWEGRGGKKKSY